jgi:hypothetical protein
MCDIIDFAIQSARRQAEICRLEWEDNASFFGEFASNAHRVFFIHGLLISASHSAVS